MTGEQEEKDTMLLDYFQACLESNISDFAISKIEDLYDEDDDEFNYETEGGYGYEYEDEDEHEVDDED